jgi:hypothetical protein
MKNNTLPFFSFFFLTSPREDMYFWNVKKWNHPRNAEEAELKKKKIESRNEERGGFGCSPSF